MENRKLYSFGGIVLAVESEIPLMTKPTLEEFCVPDDREADLAFRVLPTDENSPVIREGNTFLVPMRPEHIPQNSAVSVFLRANVAQLFVRQDAFILHAAYVLYEGRAILFTAPSGTGKSTLAEHWLNTIGGSIVNGDRVLITKRDGAFYANGIFVAGTSGICHNATAPIGYIINLEQRNTNALIPLRPMELFKRLVNECTYDDTSAQQCEQITALVADVINRADIRCYGCINAPSAAVELAKLLGVLPQNR